MSSRTAAVHRPRVTNRRLQLIWCSLLAFGLTLPLGCTQHTPYPSADLAGTVTVDGTRVARGSVTFSPLDATAGQAVGAEIQDGQYQARGVPLGKVRVTFNATRPTGKMIQVYSESRPELVNLVPGKYRAGVIIDVRDGQQEQPFHLQSE